MAKDDRKTPARTHRPDVDAFLLKVAATPVVKPAGTKGRLIFALDATASRQPMWDRACHIQAEMFAEAAGLGGLEIQMAFYRGFGEFRAAPWLSRPEDLIRRMTRVSCLGGQTQIARILEHAIAETRRRKVDALVFVGDCMEENVDHLGRLAGELGMLGVPAFFFQEGDEPTARVAFEQIARLTKGAYCSFDSSSPETLRDLLRAVAAFAAGGRRALENFSRGAGREVLLIAGQLKR